MATLPPPTRALVRPALLLSLLSLACNTPPPPTTPDPPQITIGVTESNVVGKSVKLSLTVSGCDQVQGLEVLDNNTVIKRVTASANPTPVELGISEVEGAFKRGIAANLSLTARVTCSDGRTNISAAQPATFFPVEDVVEPVDANSPVVTTYFAAEGSGAGTAFIGCGRKGNLSILYKVLKSNPTSPQELEMPIPCDETTTVTDRRPAGTGWRWVWTRDQGAFAIDKDFKITSVTLKTPDFVTVAPDGNAFVCDNQSIQLTLPTVPTGGSNVKWAYEPLELPGQLIGEPLVRTGGSTSNTVVVPLASTITSPSGDKVNLQVGVIEYSTGDWKNTYDIDSLPSSQTGPVAFDPSGTVLYVTTQGDKAANVKACDIGASSTASLCTAGSTSRLWISADLTGSMAALIPYNNGTRLAALTTNRFWFLDTKNGPTVGRGPVNKEQQPITPNGTLLTRFAQPGPPPPSAYSGSFYLFNSSASTTANPFPFPVEIVATDLAENGELFRYQIPGGSLYGALDDSGALWMRVGPRLVKPYAPDWYRTRR
ncbi:hypothetical protein [Vitiosangium sp. GDMCC 1.1324]|uniref:hypothetical protein n=1 Tax=Vitiosangium sp. (strain GDMCC 1.1324) TaxID=2138576 RepID=UPI0011B780F5|nr:hypothetical protein [Vitiosangium sp. GDMCC 1.1324]